MRRAVATVGIVTLIFACGQPGPGSSALPDYTAQQHEIWSLAPQNTVAGFTIADLSHFLARLGAFKGAAQSGKTLKKYIDQGLTEMKASAGFDLLDAKEWAARGIDVGAPVALFVLEDDKGFLVVRPSDAAKAKTELEALFAKAGANDNHCAPSGRWLVCGNGGTIAQNEASSLWPRIAREVPAADLGTEVGIFVPLDQGAIAKDLATTKDDAFEQYFAKSKSVWAGATLGEDQVVVRSYYANPDSARVAAYFKPDSGARQLLGYAVGARTVSRMFLSSKALYKLAQDSADRATMDQAQGAFQMATGLDLKKDVVENMTGEILFALWDAQGARLSGACLLGMADDARTHKMAERIDTLVSGALGAVQKALDQSGFKVQHETGSAGGRPVYSYTMVVPPEQAAQIGMDKMEVHLSTVPGALVVAFDRPSLEKLMANAGKSADEFVAQLSTPEARQIFSSGAAVASWGMAENPFGKVQKGQLDAMSAIHPDIPDAMREVGALMDLAYDGSMSFEVKPDGMHLFYQLTLL